MTLRPTQKLRILVIGAGGVGGYFGAKLALAGHAVFFIARGPHLKVMCKKGLIFRSKNGSVRLKVKAATNPPKATKFDLILICVKAYDPILFLKHLPHLLTENGLVISLQNGLNNDQFLHGIVSSEKIIPAFCILGAFIEKPGLLRHIAAGEIVLGDHPKSKGLAGILKKADIPTKIQKNFSKAQWQKFIWNLGFNGPTALLDASVGDLLKRPEYVTLVEHLIVEALSVAKKEGVFFNHPDRLAHKMLNHSKRKLSLVLTSMVIDRRNKRVMETEIFYGELCRLAKKHNLHIPQNQMVGGLLEKLNLRASEKGAPI